MARKIPTGPTKAPTDPGRGPTEPTSIGDDQYAGADRGQNFPPRNAGAVEDTLDREAARVARETSKRPGPHEDSEWEARVERGEEWLEEEDSARARRGEAAEGELPREALPAEPEQR